VLPILLAACGGGKSTGNTGTESITVIADFGTPVDSQRWTASDGWSNGGIFNNGWSASNAYIANNSLVLQLDDHCATPGVYSGKPYKSGEFASTSKYGYGKVSASMTAAKGSGLITSLFTYNAAPHDEIDVEILGSDTSKVQFNYFVNGIGGHEKIVELGFDAAVGRHIYAIDWNASGISWYVNGVLRHQVSGGALPSASGQIMVNLWPATGVDAWVGIFTYPGAPVFAYYNYIRHDSPAP